MAQTLLLLDEDVRPLLGQVLRQRGFDVVHVLELNRAGLSDDEQLRYATDQGRAIVTHNIKDFLQLDKQWRARGVVHYGILVSDQVAFSELLSRTLKCLAHYAAESLHGQVVWLHQFK